MPVSKGASAQRAFVAALAGVVAAVVLVVFVVWFVGRGENKVDIRLGDDQFRSIDARSQAKVIERDGPILYPDVSGGDRDLYVQHLGTDPLTGWLAFDARRPGETRPECTLRWDRDRRLFTDPCTPSVTVPADGSGVKQYLVRVEKNRVIIDINADPATATTAPGSTTTAAPRTTAAR